MKKAHDFSHVGVGLLPQGPTFWMPPSSKIHYGEPSSTDNDVSFTSSQWLELHCSLLPTLQNVTQSRIRRLS